VLVTATADGYVLRGESKGLISSGKWAPTHLFKTTGSGFMIVSFLNVRLAGIGFEPGAQLAEHARGRLEV